MHKHRRVEDLPEQTPAASATEGLAAACALAELTARIGTTRAAPRGVRRFTSVQEADRHRQEWELGPEA